MRAAVQSTRLPLCFSDSCSEFKWNVIEKASSYTLILGSLCCLTLISLFSPVRRWAAGSQAVQRLIEQMSHGLNLLISWGNRTWFSGFLHYWKLCFSGFTVSVSCWGGSTEVLEPFTFGEMWCCQRQDVVWGQLGGFWVFPQNSIPVCFSTHLTNKVEGGSLWNAEENLKQLCYFGE